MKFKISFHPLFLIFICLLICLGMFWVLLAYLVTITLHELAHSLVAKYKGYHLNQYTFMPHGVSLSGNNVLFTTKDEVIIALAGPLCNLCITVIIVAMWWVFPVTYQITYLFAFSNLVTAVLNFLPVFPMDGGRVLLAMLSKKYNRMKCFKYLKYLGIAISFAFILGFILTTFFQVNYTFLVLGVFIFLTVLWEDKSNIYIKTSFLVSKTENLKKGLIIREMAVSSQISLYKLLSQTNSESITNFKVLNDDLSVLGTIEESKLEKLAQIYPASASLKTILS